MIKFYEVFERWSFAAAIFAIAFSVFGCPPQGPVSPGIDASDSSVDAAPDVIPDATPVLDSVSRSPEDLACLAMAHAGCVVLSDCAATIKKVNADTHFVPINVVCLESVRSPDDVKKCGTTCGASKL